MFVAINGSLKIMNTSENLVSSLTNYISNQDLKEFSPFTVRLYWMLEVKKWFTLETELEMSFGLITCTGFSIWLLPLSIGFSLNDVLSSFGSLDESLLITS
jgi:hypothetical protein